MIKSDTTSSTTVTGRSSTVEMGEEAVLVAHQWPWRLDKLLHLPRLLWMVVLLLSVQVMKLLKLMVVLVGGGRRELMIIVHLHGCKV